MSAFSLTFSVALVVDDEPIMIRSLTRALRALDVTGVRIAHSVEEAHAQLTDEVDLVLCDLCLNDRRGHDVFAAASTLAKPPTMIAISGRAARAEVFDLMCWGVSGYLEKPFNLEDLRACLTQAARAATPLARVARAQVGRFGAREAQQVVKLTMFQEALDRTRGNRHAAARLLRVDRRIVQLMASELAGADAATRPPGDQEGG